MNERLEKNIEKYFCSQVKKAGGHTIKMGKDGNPDRLTLFPFELAYLVELKSFKGRLRPLQIEAHKKLSSVGHTVIILNSKETVDKFITRVKSRLTEIEKLYY